MTVAVGQPADELRDGFRLVTAGLVVTRKLEFHGASPLVRNLGYSKLSIIRLLSNRSSPGAYAQIFGARKRHCPQGLKPRSSLAAHVGAEAPTP